jgi:hypothetical protein
MNEPSTFNFVSPSGGRTHRFTVTSTGLSSGREIRWPIGFFPFSTSFDVEFEILEIDAI